MGHPGVVKSLENDSRKHWIEMGVGVGVGVGERAQKWREPSKVCS